MTDAIEPTVHETPLTGIHRELGARLIEFGGWLMPVQYGSILEEHRAVRERAGLFDLSHMGELHIEGPDAGAALAAALVTNPPSLAIGRAHYSMICMPDGGVIDDLIVYRLAASTFLVVANAGNAATVSDTLAERLGRFKAVLDDRSLATGLLAIQGPLSAGDPRPADRCRPGCAPLLRDRGRGGGRDPGHGGADGVHRGGRLRGIRRHEPDRRVVADPAGRRSIGRRSARRSRRTRYAPSRSGHAALRQRARICTPRRTKPAWAASSSWTSRATSSAGPRSRRSPVTVRRGSSSAWRSRAAGSPATAIRSGSANAGPAS